MTCCSRAIPVTRSVIPRRHDDMATLERLLEGKKIFAVASAKQPNAVTWTARRVELRRDIHGNQCPATHRNRR